MTRKIVSSVLSLLFILTFTFSDFLYFKFWLFSGFLILFSIIGILLVIFLNIKKDKYAMYIALIALFIGSFSMIAQQTELFKSRIIIKAALVDDLSYLELLLRENNEFELIPTSFLGRSESFQGKYKMEGDKIIFLDRPYDNEFIGDTVYIINNNIVLRFDSMGNPDTTHANHFRIETMK